MNQRVKILADEINGLTPDERSELMDRLGVLDRDEPDDGTPEEIEAAWMEEVERRIAARERGEVTLIPAEEVIARLRAKLAQ